MHPPKLSFDPGMPADQEAKADFNVWKSGKAKLQVLAPLKEVKGKWQALTKRQAHELLRDAKGEGVYCGLPS